ncbi:protein of unknown function [Bryocella elongata]|uniref:DUF3861 domain-containing protein n=1 Tax=Bryocella elongata TaxID=863522 RepID=A0A1H6CHB9_9BACT|nr:DUF3861 domain-containing protein [Bryocella elongata]SEG72268.1 protein of unknown function [Bryocella elongata]
MPLFRITVEPLPAASSALPEDASALVFDVDNHDDIIAIARRMNGRFDLDEPTSQAFAIGLKLFGEVILKNRQREPFSLIRPAMADFMKAVKGQHTSDSSAQ